VMVPVIVPVLSWASAAAAHRSIGGRNQERDVIVFPSLLKSRGHPEFEMPRASSVIVIHTIAE
jgi:hypothetical protein